MLIRYKCQRLFCKCWTTAICYLIKQNKIIINVRNEIFISLFDWATSSHLEILNSDDKNSNFSTACEKDDCKKTRKFREYKIIIIVPQIDLYPEIFQTASISLVSKQSKNVGHSI